MHVIVWCDSLTNFQRMLDRQGLKEFDTRVLLQMSPADSSLLMDTPAASLLGRHRALLHREDEGRLEKFRPYSPPPKPGSRKRRSNLPATRLWRNELNKSASKDAPRPGMPNRNFKNVFSNCMK